MIIESKQINVPLAIGLRWLVATYAEIEQLKERTDLTYGFVLSLPERSMRKYKLVALASEDHDNTMSLAALLSVKYKNLIYVNKLGNDFYWLCVIKNNAVWNDIDLGHNSIGDCLGNREKINAAMQMAINDFTESNIPLDSIMLGSNMDEDEFHELKQEKFTDIISDIRKNRKYRIKQIESYRKKIRQIIMTAIVIGLSSIISYYIYETQNETARARAAQLEAERAERQALFARTEYFRQLITKLNVNRGPNVINRFLSLAEQLPLQSQGWLVSNIYYNAESPKQLQVQLKRGRYGDVLSFNEAFKQLAFNQDISDDNNSGSMELKFENAIERPSVNPLVIQKYQKLLSGNGSKERIKLIAYAQRHNFPFKVEPASILGYDVKSSKVSITGDRLWNLRKLQFVFRQFPSMIIDTISLSVGDDREITWKVEGQIYG